MVKLYIIKSKGMIILKKYLILSIILIVLTIFYLYVANITLMPKSITLLQGEKLKLATLWGIKLVDTNLNIDSNEGALKTTNYNASLQSVGETLETSGNINENRINSVRKNRYENKSL